MPKAVARLAVDVVSAVPGSTAARAAVVVGATGVAVGAGALGMDPSGGVSHAAAPAVHSRSLQLQAQSLVQDHTSNMGAVDARSSRSLHRPPLASVEQAAKAGAMPAAKQNVSGAVTKTVAPASPQEVAMSLLGSYGWDSGQFSCLNALWTRESNWNLYAQNVSSGAYGIPQALPGSKMATAGSDWATDATTQIRWGLSYIRSSYGSPCGAWGHSESYGWY